MERGKITIQRSADREQLIVHIGLADGTIWMTKHEIADLFEVYIQTVTTNLKALFKAQELLEKDVTFIHRYEKNGRECSTTFYSLEAIIALSFRMQGGICRIFRQWMIERIKKPTVQEYKRPIIIQLKPNSLKN